MLQLGVFLTPGDVGAPAGELLGGHAAGLLRLAHHGGGALEIAVCERLRHLGRVQRCSKPATRSSADEAP